MQFILAINWGSISDWVMIIVTGVTAVFLYRTLKSQKEVQNTQNELFKIEKLRFQESIKPILRYKASDNKLIPGEDGKKILTIEVTNDSENTASEISRLVSDNENTQQIFVAMGFDHSRDYLTKGDSPLLLHFLVEKDKPVTGYLIFNVKYKDVAGNHYKQNVFCICDNHGIYIQPYLPEQISP